jgi:hypothetical protein
MALLPEQPEAHGLAATDLARALRTARASALGPMPMMLGASVLLSRALFVVRRIANGHEYQLGVRLTVLLSMIWGACTFRARWLRAPRFLAVISAIGVDCMVSRPLTIKADSEIVAAYGSAFAALDAGKNRMTAAPSSTSPNEASASSATSNIHRSSSCPTMQLPSWSAAGWCISRCGPRWRRNSPEPPARHGVPPSCAALGSSGATERAARSLAWTTHPASAVWDVRIDRTGRAEASDR